jgi:hypothetical protein
MGDKIRGASFSRQLNERFVVRIGGGGLPLAGQRTLVSQRAEDIQIGVHVGMAQLQDTRLAAKDFVVLAKDRIAQNELPLLFAKQPENFVRRALPRTQPSDQHVCVQHGLDHLPPLSSRSS